ncbi:ATP-binding protein [Pelistega sp. NLN82]|uniref:ATP-binding protein n=1 Tax=Pelistega ratti TaxID=2652177 RepID=A0A6L9Y7M1_9BURK|nr:ATP-binding protein [Pelistega ratti]NEN76510.1 ATP-binding protein [Pelistega ratti]
MQQEEIQQLIKKAISVLAQLEAWLPPAPKAIDWDAKAFRWRKKGGTAWLEAIKVIDTIEENNLLHIAQQKQAIDTNTRFFLQGKPANNVLMTGARGTGKSSLVKAMLTKYASAGLRLIEVDKSDLGDLSDIIDLISHRPERFIIFCDDLSFDEGEVSYKALKSALDGSIATRSENVLIYATSNRRHLMPEYMRENLSTHHQADGEIHPGEAIEEKISLSERFGLWLAFYPFKQEDYLAIVDYWLNTLGCPQEYIEESHTEALQWAIQRGSRSGRVARHFASDWTARHMD